MTTPIITDGELNVLEVLWAQSPLPAAQIAQRLSRHKGWNKNTTYTYITRLVEKGAVERSDPGFLCTPLLSREQVGLSQGSSLLERLYGGSLSRMVASFVRGKGVSPQELSSLRKLIEESAGDEHE